MLTLTGYQSICCLRYEGQKYPRNNRWKNEGTLRLQFLTNLGIRDEPEEIIRRFSSEQKKINLEILIFLA